jgi:hypothetical protein
MHMAGTQFGRIYDCHGCGRGDRDRQPDQGRKGEPGQSGHFQPESMARAEVPDDAKGQEEDSRRHRSQHDQRNIDDAMKLLAATAMLAIRKVGFVVAAHLRGQARDVVAPSGKNFPYDEFNTLAHRMLQPDGFQDIRLTSQHHAVLPQPLTIAQGPFGRRARKLGMIILF